MPIITAGIAEISKSRTFTLKEIQNFFENYKKLENVEVKVGEYHNKEEAIKLINECTLRYNNKLTKL